MSGRSRITCRSKRPGRSNAGSSTSGPVRRGDDDHVGRGIEPVHLDQDLVEGLLPLVVAAAEAGAALAANGVDLVDEDDARGAPLGLVEQVADPAGAHADEHLHELGAGDAEEGHTRLAGDRAREQRLAGSRWPDQEHAARDAGAEGGELVRVFEELDDLDQLFLCLVHPGDVGEGDARLVSGEEAGSAFAEAHRLVVAALGLPHHEDEDADQEQGRQQGR
jgi:hypothetical protein